MNDDMNPIIRFRKPTNQTSIDYREKFSLQSKHILKVRKLSHLEYLGVSRQDCYDGNDADQNMIQLLSLQNNW